MKKDDVEFLPFDEFENDFMLNHDKELESLVKPDTVVDTKEEKDLKDEIELDKSDEKTNKTRTSKYSNISDEEETEVKTKIVKKEKVKEENNKKDKKEKKDKKVKKEKKPVNKKVFWCQVIFCTISIAFIIGCCIFYGYRMIKYYRIYNPKTESGESAVLLGNSITTNSSIATEGDGLYKVGGSYIYKGENVNNYINFSNTTWRIISVSGDGSIEMTTDSYVNALDWNTTITDYASSDIRAWLNDTYLKSLNTDFLTNVSFCTDLVSDLSSVTCENKVTEDYVRLIGINEFLNSEVNGATFLSTDGNTIWFYNSSDTSVWNASGTTLGLNNADSGFLVKPVVHIKNSTQLISGDGSKEQPYIIEEENKKLEVGNYVKLDDGDPWVIYEVNDDNIKLALSKFMSTAYRYSNIGNAFDLSETAGVAYHLNTSYYESLTFRDLLLDTDFYNGSYTSYKDNASSTVTAKVGFLNVNDVKTNNIDPVNSYFTITPGDPNYVYMVGSTLRQTRSTISRSVKPAISIKKTDVESGKGTVDDPYILGD